MDPKRQLQKFKEESIKFDQETKDFLPYVPVCFENKEDKVKIRIN
jgi:hypothetical protein